jgi:hypothetical protein
MAGDRVSDGQDETSRELGVPRFLRDGCEQGGAELLFPEPPLALGISARLRGAVSLGLCVGHLLGAIGGHTLPQCLVQLFLFTHTRTSRPRSSPSTMTPGRAWAHAGRPSARCQLRAGLFLRRYAVREFA